MKLNLKPRKKLKGFTAYRVAVGPHEHLGGDYRHIPQDAVRDVLFAENRIGGQTEFIGIVDFVSAHGNGAVYDYITEQPLSDCTPAATAPMIAVVDSNGIFRKLVAAEWNPKARAFEMAKDAAKGPRGIVQGTADGRRIVVPIHDVRTPKPQVPGATW